MKLKQTKYLYLAIVCVFVVAICMYFFSDKSKNTGQEIQKELVNMKPKEEQEKEEIKIEETFSAEEEITQMAQGFIANFFDDKPNFLEQSLPFVHDSLTEKLKKEPRQKGYRVMNIHEEAIEKKEGSYHVSFNFELVSEAQETNSFVGEKDKNTNEAEQNNLTNETENTAKKYRCVFIFQLNQQGKWLIYDYQLIELENEQ